MVQHFFSFQKPKLFIHLNRVKKYRNDAKNGGKPVLYLNAGDTFTGTPWFKMFREKIVSDFLNALMPDAVVSKLFSLLKPI